MGGYKEEMLRREEDLSMAADYLVSIGRLEHCDAHGTIYGGGVWDLEQDFYREVMNDRNKGVNGPVPWAAEMESKQYTDLLLAAYKGNVGDSCHACDKNFRDDD